MSRPATPPPPGHAARTGPTATTVPRHVWAILLAICLPALVPVLRPGWFEGHDDLHIFRVIEYDLALRDGQIPPRWFPDVSAGYGNPHPIFYAPIFYVAAEAFHLLGLDVILSLKAAIVLFMLLAALFMYLFARTWWGPAGALVVAAAYTYAPYHMLDVYVRKAFSEFTVFAFLPALLLAFHNLWLRGTRWDMIAGALAMAAMSIAHTITLMMVPPLLGAYALFLSRHARGDGRPRWRWLPRAALAAVIGYALAGFFLVPAFLESREINLQIYTDGYMDFHKHFVQPIQLLWWPWGYGMSLEGYKDEMSFRLGLCLLAGTALAAAGLSRLRRRGAPGARHVVFFLGLTAAAVFMMLPVSTIVWELLPPMKFVQFPWRFLTLTTLSTAFLCGAAFTAFAPEAAAPARRKGSAAPPRAEPWAAALAACAVLVLEATLGWTLTVHHRFPSDRITFEEKPYSNMVERKPDAPFEPFDGDFVRRHTLHWIDHLPPGVSSMAPDPNDLARPRVQVQSGAASIEGLWTRTASLGFTVEAQTPARLRLNIYRFPGWTVRVDGAPAPLVNVPRQTRVIYVDVAPGRHAVQATFENTLPRTLGDVLTLAGLAALALAGLWPQRAGGAAPGAAVAGAA